MRDAKFYEIVRIIIPIILQFIQITKEREEGWYVKNYCKKIFSELRFMASNRINNYAKERKFLLFMHITFLIIFFKFLWPRMSVDSCSLKCIWSNIAYFYWQCSVFQLDFHNLINDSLFRLSTLWNHYLWKYEICHWLCSAILQKRTVYYLYYCRYINIVEIIVWK